MSNLRITESVIDQAVFDDPQILEVIDQIRAMDSNKDGEVTLSEVAKVVKDLDQSNKMRAYMRRIIILLLMLFILLGITMVVLIVLMRQMYVNATSEGGLLVEKTTGIPLTVGSPSVGIYFSDNQLNTLSQLYNNTPVNTLENSFRRRKLMAIPGKAASCSKPIVRALATDTVASVIEKCKYISKSGTDSKITLRISRGLDGKPTIQQIGEIETCGTFHDQIHVLEDQCSLMMDSVSCPVANANHTATVIWADSTLHQDHIASYAITCQGNCGADLAVQWNICGVSLNECPKTASTANVVSPADMAAGAGGRRLNTLPENDEEVVVSIGDAMGIGIKMNCETGSCFAVV